MKYCNRFFSWAFELRNDHYLFGNRTGSKGFAIDEVTVTGGNHICDPFNLCWVVRPDGYDLETQEIPRNSGVG